MRRELAALALLIGLLLAGLVGYRFLFPPGEHEALLLREVSGAVQHRRAEGEIAAVAGAAVRPGEGIVAGADGAAVLAFGDDSRLTVRAETSLQVVGVSAEGVLVELEGGRVQATVRAGGAPIALRTGDRQVTTRDGEVDVARSADGAVVVEPARGGVELLGFGVDRVEAGQRAVAAPGGAAQIVAGGQELLLRFVSEPPRATREASVRLHGLTEPGARVVVQGGTTTRTTVAEADGAFVVEVELGEGANHLRVQASDAAGHARALTVEVERDSRADPVRIEIGEPR